MIKLYDLTTLLVQFGMIMMCFGIGMIGKNGFDLKQSVFCAMIGVTIMTYTTYLPLWAYSVPIIGAFALGMMGRESYGQ